MMTTNKLTKTFASGSLAIGVLAGAVLTATSASAASMVLTWDQWTSGTDLEVGDKIVKFKPGSITGGFVAEAVDKVALTEMGGHYYFRYDAMDGLADTNMSSGSFTYTIEVTDPNKYITAVALDSDVTATYNNVTKFVQEPNITLTSTNGSADPLFGFYPIAPTQLLTVTDTITANPGEGLFSLNNAYKQTTVPEPGTILGLLTVGGLGLVSRLKKQK